MRKTRENLLEAPSTVPPPCLGCAADAPQRQKSVSRRVFSAVKQGLSRSDSSQRSVTGSTVSTTELVGEFGTLSVTVPSGPEEAPEHPTEEDDIRSRYLPRLLPTNGPLRVTVPFIDLQVATDTAYVDVNAKRDVWIAITATARLHTITLPERVNTLPPPSPPHTPTPPPPLLTAAIPALRLHFQPAPRHRVLQTLGDRSARQLRPDASCELFVRVRVPRHAPTPSDPPSELEALFAELESTLGTLETEVLHVEARYKHGLIEESNSVTVRRVARLRRVRPESRWSLCCDGPADGGLMEVRREAEGRKVVHEKMARWMDEHARPLGPPWM